MASWKKNRMSFDDIKKKGKEEKEGGYERDSRMWIPHRDEKGIGSAIIRFLPPAEGASDPWVKLYSHGFEGKGWYIENCPTTLGKDNPCPACEANREIVEQHGDGDWKKVPDRYQAVVRSRKRNLSYYSNILVVKDDAHPENEGKVFIFRYGVKIFNKIMDAISPQFEDEKAINPFDFIDGANFKLKIRKVDGNVNYDKSEFDAVSPVAGGDEDEIEKIYESMHDLSSLISPDKFSSYEDAKKRLNKVLGLSASAPVSNTVDEDDSPWAKKDAPQQTQTQTVEKTESPVTQEAMTEKVADVTEDAPIATDDDVDDAMAFFASMEDD